MTTPWTNVKDWPVESGVMVLLGNRAWRDPEMNPTGVVEGYYQDGEGWIGSVWNNHQDCWVGQVVHPQYVMAVPRLPEH